MYNIYNTGNTLNTPILSFPAAGPFKLWASAEAPNRALKGPQDASKQGPSREQIKFDQIACKKHFTVQSFNHT